MSNSLFKAIVLSVLVHIILVAVILVVEDSTNKVLQNFDAVNLEYANQMNSRSQRTSVKVQNTKTAQTAQMKDKPSESLKEVAHIGDSLTSNKSALSEEDKREKTSATNTNLINANENSDDTSLSVVNQNQVTSQVSILSMPKIQYPLEAKKANIEGPVVLELVIDSTGQVRQIKLVKGPGYGLNEAAIEAVKKFKFKPALIGTQPVAVKIKYTYKFVLEVQ